MRKRRASAQSPASTGYFPKAKPILYLIYLSCSDPDQGFDFKMANDLSSAKLEESWPLLARPSVKQQEELKI
jgi:hypothetical protein